MNASDPSKGAPIKEAPAGPTRRRYCDLSTLISSIADAIIAFGLLSTERSVSKIRIKCGVIPGTERSEGAVHPNSNHSCN
jgi:hypothetical protein